MSYKIYNSWYKWFSKTHGMLGLIRISDVWNHWGYVTRGPFYRHGLTLIPVWTSNYSQFKVWDESTYPFPNLHGSTVEGWKWVTHFIPHFVVQIIIYPCWKFIHISKWPPGDNLLFLISVKGNHHHIITINIDNNKNTITKNTINILSCHTIFRC